MLQANGNIPERDARYEEALTALDGLITGTKRNPRNKWVHPFEGMQGFLDTLELTDALGKLKIVHVAGTKGKGSTCAMVESMLRRSGYRTGLFTSPHLVDVRERIRINGRPIEKDLFLDHFWWTHSRLAERRDNHHRMAAYFRFLTLLAFRVFSKEVVDVAIIEVGLGGRLDSTNCIRSPVVCGIAALGFDHMNILGHTLPEIAREKAGIFKPGVPAFTVPQPQDAMDALQAVAKSVGVTLKEVPQLQQTFQLDAEQLNLRLGGAHQLQNASLAVALATAWESKAGVEMAAHRKAAEGRLSQLTRGHLPAEYLTGIQLCEWPGRSQVIRDQQEGIDQHLTFYFDGAHTPESMTTCAQWFADSVTSEAQDGTLSESPGASSPSPSNSEVQRVLIFNCMEEREPASLLRPLITTLHRCQALPEHALFVAPDSTYASVKAVMGGTRDLSWQQNLATVWRKYTPQEGTHAVSPPEGSPIKLPRCGTRALDSRHGTAVPSLSEALKWLRSCARQQPQRKVQVLVTGSLYIVGDLLRHLGHSPT